MVLHQKSLTLITIITILITTTSIATIARAQNSSFCKTTCGSGKSAKSVQYPFGFTEGCTIPLTCSDKNEIKLGKFTVQNVTGSSIFVHLPSQCNRKYQSIAPLFGQYFGPSWNNSLLYQNCTSPLPGCQIPAEFVQNRLNLSSCDNITCMSQAPNGSDIMTLEDLNQTRCNYLFGSFSAQSGRDSLLSLEFEKLQLSWWVNTSQSTNRCDCHSNATSTTVKLGETRPPGCRCSCNAGFDGDGFQRGSGCKTSQPDLNGSYRPLKSSPAIAGIIVAVIAGALILGGGAYYYRKKKIKPEESNGAARVLTGIKVHKSVEYSYEELARATDNFSLANKIGQGGFGAVYYAELRGEKAAIKKMDTQASKEFLAELNVLTRVHHSNLVRLIGYCVEGSLFLVYEYIENGNLSQHLRGSGRDPLPWSNRVQIALDSARGLEYIHEHTVPVYIHRDIKSANILIDKNFHAKVADFGLAKLIEVGNTSLPTRFAGTFGYMPPEYARCGGASTKVDVYAFGVVIYELISAKEAVVRADSSGSEPRGLVCLFDEVLNQPDPKDDLWKLVDPGLGDNYPLDSVRKMAQLAKACTHENRELRPSMQSIVVALMTLSSSTEDWDVGSLYENQALSSSTENWDVISFYEREILLSSFQRHD